MSIRRLLVDDFFFQNVGAIPRGGVVIDIGGTKIKSGCFDISKYGFQVYCANISAAKGVDVVADGANLPFASACADAAICAETLEHVPSPPAILAEGARILKTGGLFLATAPFFYWQHADPADYGRYTAQYWRENLARAGFCEIEAVAQGGFWCVIADFLWYITLERAACAVEFLKMMAA